MEEVSQQPRAWQGPRPVCSDQPSAASDFQQWSHKSFLNSCSPDPRHLSLGRRLCLLLHPFFYSQCLGKRPVLLSQDTLLHRTSPSWFRASEKQNFLSPAVWEPRGAARACGRARGRGWRGSGGPGKEEGASPPRLGPLPVCHRLPRPPAPHSRAQQAARCMAGVPGALPSPAGVTATQVGPGRHEVGNAACRNPGVVRVITLVLRALVQGREIEARSGRAGRGRSVSRGHCSLRSSTS